MSTHGDEKSGRKSPLPETSHTLNVPKGKSPKNSNPPSQTGSGRSSPDHAEEKNVLATQDGRQTRSATAAQLPTVLELKVKTQYGRASTLKTIAEDIPDDPFSTSLTEVSQLTAQIDEVFKAFSKEHSFLEQTWPAAFLDNPYFAEDLFTSVSNSVLRMKRLLTRLKSTLETSVQDDGTAADRRFNSKLPDISLPTFDGEYSKWPSYSELFTSIILDNSRLSNIEKLHYLRSSLTGEASQLINNMPLVGSSLQPSWESLTKRFENKRLIMQKYLDRLCTIKTATAHDAASLNRILTVVSESTKALTTLGAGEVLWDCMLVHHVSAHLDRATRELWETSIGDSTEYPTYSQLESFLTARARTLERLESTSAETLVSSSKPAQPRKQGSHTASTTQPEVSQAAQRALPPYPCDLCANSGHFIVACPKFRELTPAGRLQHAISKRLCFNCLGRHSSRACKSSTGCKKCRSKHHTMLHEAPPTAASYELVKTAHHATLNQGTLLATAVANLKTLVSAHPVRLLIDPGSELTFVSEALISQFKIHRRKSTLTITGIGGKVATHTRGTAQLILQSAHHEATVVLQAHVLSSLTSVLPTFNQPSLSWRHIKKLQLADPDFLTPRSIDIIIGADNYGQIIKPNIVQASAFEPIAQLSIFGWLIHGPVNTRQAQPSATLCAGVQGEESSLQDALTKFWLQEEIPSDCSAELSPEDQQCEDHFRTTHSRDASGRYIVRLPLKMSASLLGDSYTTAHHCLQRTISRLKRNCDYRQLYAEFMAEYERLNHMQRPPADVSSSRLYYLPHHGVLRPDRETTKLRVVFNGSSPTTTGYSVNDIMHTGPNLYLELSDVLIWIRHHRHIFATDITKMYRQIKIHQDDWDLQRILWIDEHQNEMPYQLTTVTYGTKAAPYLATRTLLQLADDEGDKFPLAMPSFKFGRYVDDLFGGADSNAELIEIAHQLIALCNAGRLPLAKWHSNTPELLTEVSATAQENSGISFDDCNTKILGVKWSPHADEFRFSSKSQAFSGKLTKRLILSEVAQIYDPLGFISPVVIRAKMLLQELWLHKIGWDDPLSPSISSKWLTIREDFIRLASLSIPRWFNTRKNSSVQLHGFSDASQLALSAVIYLVVNTSSTGAKVSLVCSKTKVAPLKQVTIPRLELTAALLLAKLMHRVQATLQLNIESTHMWTDSQVTLKWISTHASRWKDYVRNRVTQIQELSQHAQWRHVPGKLNPADCASRGLTTAQLEKHDLWWTGPPWLARAQDSWPPQPSLPDDCILEARPGISLFSASPKAECHWDLIERYSSVSKLFRVTALCYRVISRWRGEQDSTPVSIISAADMEKAKRLWIKSTQAAHFGSEIKQLIASSPLSPSHPFSRLTAFIDQEGVVRVGGRLERSDLSFENKHPAILPRHSRLSTLIIDHAHKTTLHGGTQQTLAHIRQSYWIIGGRAPVKSHVLRCVKCARQRGIRAQQLMGQLPLSRVSPTRPFTHTGVDYAGPITLKTWRGRGSKTHKGWICVFVCFATSAVHLEAVTDYSTDGFLATYRRFTSRRGIPRTLNSDCGTNFIGADTTLKKLFSQSSQEHHTIAAVLSQDQTQWNFNPPAAPHMGGKWEAVVKSAKHHLRRTVGETLLTYEEFSTLLAQIEAVLNSRPLEPLSDDPEDISALTPAHFLIGNAISTIPEPSLQDSKVSRLSNWQLIQQKMQSFWSQWSRQYLQRYQAISKWHHPNNVIKEGSLVLLTDERFQPCKWPLARVIALHPGKDQLTRVVTLKTATTTLTRPITKLTILPVSTPEKPFNPQIS